MASQLMDEKVVVAAGMQCCNSNRACCADKCMSWRQQVVLELGPPEPVDMGNGNTELQQLKKTVPTGKGWCLMVPDIDYK